MPLPRPSVRLRRKSRQATSKGLPARRRSAAKLDLFRANAPMDRHDGDPRVHARFAFAGSYYRLATRWLRPSSLCPSEDETIAPAGGRGTFRHGLEAPQHADPDEGGLRPDRPAERAHVRLRADGLRLRPYRQRAAADRLRRAVPPAPPPLRRRSTSPMSATSPTSTTRSTRAAAEEYPGLPLNEAIRKVTEKTETQFHEDVAALGCLPPTRRAARDRIHQRPTRRRT